MATTVEEQASEYHFHNNYQLLYQYLLMVATAEEHYRSKK